MDISKETRKAFKFYTSLFLGFALLIVGCFCDPQGFISSSVLIGSGMLLTISAGCIGIDLAEIIHQLTILRSQNLNSIKELNKDA